MDTELGKVLTYCERHPLLKPHDLLITLAARGLETIAKMDISTFTGFMATKLGRVLTLERRFSTDMLKLSPTSSFISFQ